MAQVSYGTITITDTNDIERIYTVYAKSANNTTVPAAAAANWKESISEAPGSGNYIWQRTVVQKSGTQEKTYSDPVCLTGEEGTDGRGITSITIKYGTSADWNTQPSNWYDNTPEYSSSTPNYWTQTTISYTTGNPTVKVTQDKALTQAIYDSIVANSLAQSANENANGAMGQAASNVNSIVRLWRAKSERSIPSAPTSEITTGSASEYTNWSTIKPTATDTYRYFYYCDQSKTGGGVCTWSEVIEDTSYLSTYEINSLNVRTKNFFKGLDNSYDGWFASGRAENEGLVTNNAETYHYNARFAATHIALGYNKTPIIDLDGGSGAINIYRFPTINSNTGLVTTTGALGMKLSATDLIFYKPPVGNNSPVAAATLNANGLSIVDGSIELANGTNDSVKISNSDFTRSINSISRSNLRMAIGSKFGVKNDGTLYASNATISGTITVGSGSDLSAGLTDYSTTSQTQSYVTGLGYQTSSDVNTIISNTSVSALSDGDDYAKTTDIPDVSGLASKTDTVQSVSTETQYRLSDSSTSLTGSGTGYSWSTTIPTWSSGKYLWTRIATTYTPISGNATTVYTPGTSSNQYGIYDSQLTSALSTALSAQTTANGAAASITTTQQYNLSSSTSSANGTWQDTVPTWSANNYIWVRLKIVKTPMSGTATTSYTPSEGGTYDKALTTALSTAASAQATANAAAPQSAAIAEEQLIYIQATSGTNSVSAYPSSSTTTSSYWVTQTGESIPNGTPPDSATGQTPRWTTKRPSYQKNYPVIFIAKQKKTVSGAITCTTPIKDDTTTIIDGGHITTGTIDASRLSVYDATINKISASAIDVGSIQIGQNQVTNLTTTLSNKASINAEYSVEIIPSNFNPAATSGNLVTLTAKVTRVDGGSTSGLTYQWFGDNTSLGAASTTATSYNVPYNTTYTTFTVEIN